MKKILVSRTDGIGDLLLTTPLIKALKESRGNPYVSVLASRYASAALQNNPSVDEVIVYEKGNEKSIIKKLKLGNFDCAVAAYARPEIAWLLFAAGIKERYGTANRWYSPVLFNRRVNVSRKKSEKHEADYNLMLAYDICGEVAADREYMYLSEVELRQGREYRIKKGLPEKFVIVHPGSKGSAWNISEKKYAELIDELCKLNTWGLLITGGPAERDKLSRIKSMVKNTGGCAGFMEEELDFRTFAGVIAASSCVISSSTGPMHMAAALGVNTLSFFPPDAVAAMASRRWKPLGNKSDIIKPSVQRKSAEESMDTIGVNEVINRFNLLCGGKT